MTSVTLIVDVSQVADAHLPAESFIPGIRDIIVIARSDQYAESTPFEPVVSWILVDPTLTERQRFARASHHVSTDWLIYTSGTWPTTVEIQRELDERTAFLIGQRLAEGEEPSDTDRLEMSPPVFVMQVRVYGVLQGFNASITRFADALADYSLRCQLLGWNVDRDDPAIIVSGPRATATDDARGETYDVQRELPEKVRLIANVPHWPHKPHGLAPLVSVVISTRNRAEFIAESINSIRLQTFQDFEIIVVDDGGTDNTKEIIDSLGDPRIRYFWREHAGIAAARNYGADQARGYFTAVHDSDDIMLPRRLELGLRALHNEFTASYGAWVNFNAASEDLIMHVTKEDFDLDVLAVTGQATGHPTWLIPTWVIRKLRYDTRLTSAVDHNLAARTALLGLRWKHVGKAVVLRRIHDGQVSAFDVKSQELGAQLTRQFAVVGLRADVERSAHDRVKKHHPWARVEERDDLEANFGMYLPGKGWPTAIMMAGPLASKLGILTNYEGNVLLTAETHENGRVKRERTWILNPDVEALAELAANGYPFEAVSATSDEELGGLAVKWLNDRLLEFEQTADEQPLLVATTEGPLDLSVEGGICLYVRQLDGHDTWKVAIPVTTPEEVQATVTRYQLNSPIVMVNEPRELEELMAMIGADVL